MVEIFADVRWNLAFEEIKKQFNLQNILPEQEESIRQFFKYQICQSKQ